MLCLKVDRYQISADSYNFVLQECRKATRGKTKGKDIVVDLGFYSTLAGAVVALQRRTLSESTSEDITTLLEEIFRSEERIKDAVRKQCG
jgi:hypothetical protein